MAFGLFDKPEPPISDVGEERWDNDLTQETRAKIEDLAAFNSDLINPTKMETHGRITPYHALLTKESKVSNITVEDRELLHKWRALLDHALFLKLPETTQVIHAEMQDFLATSSSVDGFERKSLISSISNIFKRQVSSEPQKKQLI